MSDDFQKVRVVYMGKTELTKGWGILIAPLDLIRLRPHSGGSPFDEKGANFSVIGGVYECECKIEDGKIVTYRPGSVRWTDEALGIDPDIVASWELRTNTSRLAQRAAQMHKKAAGDTPLAAVIDRLRFAYNTTPRAQRTAFKVWLLNELDK